MKTDLILVESPLQLLNAYEAIHFFNLDDYRILLRFSNVKKNDCQISKLLKTLDFNVDCLETVVINESSKTSSDFLKLILYRYKFIFSSERINRLFIGNFKSRFFSVIRSQFKEKQVILLDDGSITLEIQKSFSNDSSFDLFTMYSMEPYRNQNIYLNTFTEIKKRSEQSLQFSKSNVLFLGSGLSEIDILSELEYIRLITKILLYYKEQGRSVLYVPHRCETGEKVNSISRLSNVEILHIDYPIELYGIFEKKIPATVASFYSTALITMKNIYNLHSQAFLFNYKGSIHQEAIDDIYFYYTNKIDVLDSNELLVSLAES